MSYYTTHYCIFIKNNNTSNLVWRGLVVLLYIDLYFQLFISTIVIYNNVNTHKDLAVKHNKGKLGICRWVYIESDISYIGSSVDLSKRFSQYFNYNNISNPKHKMAVYPKLWLYNV